MDCLTKKKYKAGGYTRLSIIEGDNEEESVSITNQKNYIKEFAERNDIELYDFYVDDGYSGGNFDRPGFKKLINDIECGIINCIITKDTSRLGRDFIETGNYIYKYFPENDIRYIAILDNFDTEKPSEADDIIPFKTVVNDMYLKDTSRKIKSARRGLMESGLFVGSSVPYGYKRSEEDNRKFIVDVYASEVVKRIFTMKSDGYTHNMIARALTDDNILPPDVYKGKKMTKSFTTNLWKASSVEHILNNEVYIGTLIQGKYSRVSLKSKKKKLLPRSHWIIKKNNHPAIIDKKLFEKTNNKSKKLIKDDTRNNKYDYLLKGLVVCADCGKTMLVRRCKSQAKATKGQVYAIYCCKTYATYRNNICSMHYYREDDLNELVLKEVRTILAKYSNDEELGNEYESTLSNNNILDKYKNELDINENKHRELDKAISELYKDKVAELISTEDFTSIKKDLEIEKIKVSKVIDDLKQMLGNAKTNLTDEKSKKKMISNFLKMKNPNKQILKELIYKITIDESKNVKIYFKFNINGAL